MNKKTNIFKFQCLFPVIKCTLLPTINVEMQVFFTPSFVLPPASSLSYAHNPETLPQGQSKGLVFINQMWNLRAVKKKKYILLQH